MGVALLVLSLAATWRLLQLRRAVAQVTGLGWVGKALFQYVSNYSCHFIDLSDVDKMIFLLSSEDNIIRAVAKYCYCAFEVRQAIV